MHPFLTLLQQRIVYFDGAMGTRLQARGLTGGEPPENWNLSRPDEVKAVYRSYLDAGADMVTANTFGANPLHFENWRPLLREGLRLAREAVAEAGRTAYVALDAGSVGRLLKPLGELEFEDAVTIYRDMALEGIGAGCDLLIAETMTDLREVKAAVLGYREAQRTAGTELPVLVSLSFDVNGRLLTGADIEGTAALLTGMEGVDALGMNCGREPAALLPNLKRLLACAEGKPVFFMPNASVPTIVDGKTVFATQPEVFAQDMAEAARLGARGLGGCCGTTEQHIAAVVAATRGMPVAANGSVADPDDGLATTVISGRSGTVTLGGRTLAIGERLNPTGKKRMKQALREGDMDYLLGEATAQMEAGADALDVNVGLPDIDEPALLAQVTEAVQGVTGAPLQLDTADPAALERALRVYVGKPIINSVNGKRAVLDAVFPLVRRYGGALVCLLLDENGIPETAEGRIAIARRILVEAEKYGVPIKDLLFDALTMTVATDPNAARTTLDTVRRLHDELRVKTVLGVSNVSFGLPGRGLLTAGFLAMAMERGLSAAIVNPLDESVRAAYDAACAVLGYDEGFAGYLARYSAAPQKSAPDAPAPETAAAREAVRLAGEAIRRAEAALQISQTAAGTSPCACAACAAAASPQESPAPVAVPAADGEALMHAILRGLAKAAEDAARARMDAGEAPLSVVEKGVIPALTEVGARYERGEFFLPQLMQSANAAKRAIAAAAERMPESKPSASRTVLLATVHGDVHDIGKNIVATLLNSYGFGVIDLGRDVPPEKVVAAAKEAGVKLVGLSALMTTTVPAMRETIVQLRRELPEVKIMVGGAVLTPELARDLGADSYSGDAMGAVRYAAETLPSA